VDILINGDYFMFYYINMFFICSIFGYFMETSLKTFLFKGMNNGILFGPWIPIYGIGAMIICLVSDQVFKRFHFRKSVKFVIAVLLSTFLLTMLEFLTGNLIEMLFHKVSWNYNQLKFHFGHYIALEISLVWALFTILFMKFIRPFIDKFIIKIPKSLSVLFFGILVVDFFFSILLMF